MGNKIVESPYVRAIEILTDNGFGQDLSTVLVACACRNALDAYEEEEKVRETSFDAFCRVAGDLWVDCEDRTSLCVIADWLVQWVIRRPRGDWSDWPNWPDWPANYPTLRDWAESEGI